MKQILIPLAILDLERDSKAIRSFARSTYIKKLVAFNAIPIFTSAFMQNNMIDEIYNICDGVLFMGGGDFDAKYYNEENHQQTVHNEPLRDELELYILQKVLKDKKPFLGICRGAQALAIASGGSLYQHLPDQNLSEVHNLLPNQTYENLFTNDLHIVEIEKNTKAYELLGVDKINSNTAHHQAIKTFGSDFRISGKSQAGIVEIIEHTDPNYFCFGIQFHAEAMSGITDRFIEELVK